MKLHRLGPYILLLAGTCSCSEEGVDRHIENRLTISQGVYGQTLSYQPTSSEPLVYYREDLVVFTGAEPVNAASVVLASDTADDHGFFQIELAVGGYFLCTTSRRCIGVTVDSGECGRFDFELGEQGVWSHVQTIRCP
jgi:hypothetical protein